MNMKNTNHPVDDIFSRGLNDFQVAPSAEVKKKVFASPAAIKPIKPWYFSSQNILIISSAILIFSIVVYFVLYNNTNENNRIAISNQQNIQNGLISADLQSNKNAKPINNLSVTETKSNFEKKITPSTSNNIVQSNEIKTTSPSIHKIAETINENNPANIIATPPVSLSKIEYKGNIPSSNIAQISTKDQTTNIDISNNGIGTSIEKEVTTYKIESQNMLNPEFITKTKNSSILNNTPTLQTDLNILEENNLFFLNRRTPFLMDVSPLNEFSLAPLSSDYHLKGFWYLECKLGAFVTNYKVEASSNEFDKAAIAKENLLKSSPGYDFQLNLQFQKHNWFVKGGISFVNYGEILKGNILLENPYNDTSVSFNGNYDILIGGNYYNIDTLGSYYHYTYTQTDHISVTDSILAWNTQNVIADVYDTTTSIKFDTLPKATIYNSIRYLEFPISVGYVIPLGTFSIGISAGISPGLFMAVKGSDMNANQYPALESYDKNSIRKFSISATGEMELGYQINESLLLSLSPFYKRSLLPMYEDGNLINQKASHYGFKIGIRKLL
jgi:hypothetical protein